MGFLIILTVLALSLLGFVMGVVAAGLCGVLAARRKMDVGYYASSGALFGATLTGWPYVIARMANRSLSIPAMVGVYLLPYTLWIGIIVLLLIYNHGIWALTLGFDEWFFSLPVERRGDVDTASFWSFLLSIVTVACLVTWVMSVRQLYRRYRRDRADGGEPYTVDGVYILPFLHFYGWCAGGVVVAAVFLYYLTHVIGIPDILFF